ncbi:MAG: hypothetical protein PGMFKBFP_02340 [Anaerolineales bacterium]|nr:hypothetical protein [Anaerolineales bacterium]
MRDVHGLAHSRELARTLLSHSQRLLNSILGIVTTATTFTTYPHQQFYQISGLLTGDDAITKVMAVREGSRDLIHLANIRQLTHLDTRWVRAIGPRFDAWTQLGRDMLIIYPAKTVGSAVTVVGAKLTTALTGEDTALELPNEYHDHIVSLAEIMLLAKQRDLVQAVRQLQRLSNALKTDVAPIKLHVGDQPAMVNAGTVTPPKQ